MLTLDDIIHYELVHTFGLWSFMEVEEWLLSLYDDLSILYRGSDGVACQTSHGGDVRHRVSAFLPAAAWILVLEELGHHCGRYLGHGCGSFLVSGFLLPLLLIKCTIVDNSLILVSSIALPCDVLLSACSLVLGNMTRRLLPLPQINLLRSQTHQDRVRPVIQSALNNVEHTPFVIRRLFFSLSKSIEKRFPGFGLFMVAPEIDPFQCQNTSVPDRGLSLFLSTLCLAGGHVLLSQVCMPGVGES